MDICRIAPEVAQHLDGDEIADVRERVDWWIELERRALDGLFD